MNQTACSAANIKPRGWPETRFGPCADQSASLGRDKLAAGFGLVEVMVAMVIGMLGIIVMMQMFSMFEGQKRTTTGGDDAINSGSVSLYGMQRDIQQSGWGISDVQLIGCTVGGMLGGGSAATILLAPVTINSALIPAGDDNTDTLLVMSGNGTGSVEGVTIMSTAGLVYSMQSAPAFAVADRVLAVPKARPPCALTLTTVAAGGINLPAGTVTVSAAAPFAVTTDDKLFNLGTTPSIRVYAIRNRNLTVCDYRASDCGDATDADNTNPNGDVWVPIANNVVSLRAEYGRDTTLALASATVQAGSMDGVVDVWDQVRSTNATPPVPTVSTNGTKNTYACGLMRVSAVRLALVARSSQPEKTLDWPLLTQHVTPAVREWAGSDAAAIAIDATEAAAVAIALPSPAVDWPTWQDFRYKVFQTVVPLRNITSQGVLAEC